MSMNETKLNIEIESSKAVRKAASKMQAKPAHQKAQRAFELFKTIQGIDIELQNKINWKNLIKRLRNPGDLTNALTEEMRALLTEKLSSKEMAEKILTSEEQLFVNRLLEKESSWELRHATHDDDYEIIARQKELLSLKERIRRGISIENSNTNSAVGHDDNVFLSLAPGEGSTVRFMDGPDSTVITFDYSKELRQGKKTFSHLWSSGHMHAFIEEQDGEPVVIAGTTYLVNYRKEIDPITSETRFLKHCIFIHPNGEKHIQTLTKADEIFIHPRIDIAVVLMSVEKIRLLGKKAWETIMNPALELNALQEVVKAFFHPGVFEVHKPAQLSFDPLINPNVAIKPKNIHECNKDTDTSLILKLIQSVLKGESKEVMEVLRENSNIDINKSVMIYAKMPGKLLDKKLSIFGAAILGGSCELLEFLFQRNVDLSNSPALEYLERDDPYNPSSICITLHPLTLSLLRSDVDYMKKLHITVFQDQSEWLYNNTHIQDTCNIIRVLCGIGSLSKQCTFISHPVVLEAEVINIALVLARPQLEALEKSLTYFEGSRQGKALSLALGVATDSTALVEKMLSLGADVNRCFNPKDRDFFGSSMNFAVVLQQPYPCIVQGFTPLMVAIKCNNEAMVNLLLERGADVNTIFSVAVSDDEMGISRPILVTPEEGFTPIFFAVQSLNLNIIRLLLENDANIHYRNAKNQTVIDFARQQGGTELLDFIHTHAKNQQVVEQPLLDLTEEASPFSIHHHTASLIITGIDSRNERFYYLMSPDEETWMWKERRCIFPFSCFPKYTLRELSGSGPSIAEEILKRFQIQDPHLKKHYALKSLGVLSCGIMTDKVHYAHQMMSLELDKKLSEILLMTLADSQDVGIGLSKSMFEQNVLENEFEDFLGKEQTRHMSNELLHLLFSQDTLVPFSKAELDSLNKHYAEFYTIQHQLKELVASGDVEALQNLIAEKKPFLDFRTPTSRQPEPEYYKTDNLHAYTESPFELAVLQSQERIVPIFIKEEPGITTYRNQILFKAVPLILKIDSVEILHSIMNCYPELLDLAGWSVINFPAFLCWESLLDAANRMNLDKKFWIQNAYQYIISAYKNVPHPTVEQTNHFIKALRKAIDCTASDSDLSLDPSVFTKALLNNQMECALQLLELLKISEANVGKKLYPPVQEMDELILNNPKILLECCRIILSDKHVQRGAWSPFVYIVKALSLTGLGREFIHTQIEPIYSRECRDLVDMKTAIVKDDAKKLELLLEKINPYVEVLDSHAVKQENNIDYIVEFLTPLYLLVNVGACVTQSQCSTLLLEKIKHDHVKSTEPWLSPALTTLETKTSDEKYQVFISTAHKDPKDELSGTGDVDYATALQESLNVKTPGSAIYIRKIFSEAQIYAYVRAHQATENPILHVMINAPRTGFAFSPTGLERFKRSGGTIVMTAVEFYKHEGRDPSYISDSLAYLQKADKVIFLDEQDKKSAMESLHLDTRAGFSDSKEFADRLSKALVIPVPPTVLVGALDPETRGGDIISFGMIRVGKGLAHVIKLANLIKNSQDARVQNKKVLVVGTVNQDQGSIKQLMKLMESVYPSEKSNIRTINPVLANAAETLKALLTKFQTTEGLVPAIPLEIHVDVPKEKLFPLFSRCTYSFLPAYRGATLRNSSISSSIAQGWITYSHSDIITPPSIRTGGSYADALVCLDNLVDEEGDTNYALYADTVLEDIAVRETNPRFNTETYEATQRLMREVLNREKVCEIHQAIYDELIIKPERSASVVFNTLQSPDPASKTEAAMQDTEAVSPSDGNNLPPVKMHLE